MLELFSSNVAAFAVACILVEITPGPNMGYIAVLSAAHGRRAGFVAVAGIAIGLAVVGVAAALGVATAIINSPLIYQVMRWVGIGYLLWLAWDGWSTAKEPIDASPGHVELPWRHFRRGLVTNLLNPKAGLFYVAVLPSFVDPAGDVVAQTLTLSLVFVAIATAIHVGVVTLAGFAAALLDDPVQATRVRRVLSVMLAGIALWFGWSTRP